MPGRDALLSTKIGVQPRRSRSVDRARLRALLDGAPEARLVLVSAPAGFGKSTLLAAWLDRADVRSAWLSLDPRDQDVVRFTRYLEAAVAQLSGGTDEPVMRDSSGPFDAELALASVIDQVVDAVADAHASAAVLVLDDYHVIGEPAIHQLVGSLIERLPPRARLAIATRSDPPLPLARLRARGGAAGDPGRRPALLDGRSRRAAAFRLDRARGGRGRGARGADRGLGSGAAIGRHLARWPTPTRPSSCTASELAIASSSTTSSRRSLPDCRPRPRSSSCAPLSSSACADRSAIR